MPEVYTQLHGIKERLEEHYKDYFDTTQPSPYMSRIMPVTNNAIPGVTHIDGTARIQTVTRKQPIITWAAIGFEFNQTKRSLSLKVTGTTGTDGYCDVAVPSSLVWGTFTLTMDGYPLAEDTEYTQTYNGTHYKFHIGYIHSNHTIEIVASNETSTEPEPTTPEPTEPTPTEPEPTTPEPTEPVATTETAIIAVVAVAIIIGVVAYWRIKKRK